MNIRNQFTISIVVFTVVLLFIAFSVIWTNQQTAQLSHLKETSERIEHGADELNYFSNSYLLHQESSQLAGWQSKFSSMSDDLSSLKPSSPEQQNSIRNIQSDMQLYHAAFVEVVSVLENVPPNQSVTTLPAFQTAWNNMVMRHETLASNVSQLEQSFSDQITQLISTSIVLIFASLGAFGAYLIINYLMIYRGALKSISELQTGIRVIGSGNLDHPIKVGRNDEIGELSGAFNRMADNLKSITTSRTELEKEIAERKRMQNVIEEYNKRLEKTVEERTRQLKDAERFAAIGQTAGMVGHDIRNPLQSILSELYLSKDEIAAIAQEDIKNSLAESISNIENDIIYINKIVLDLQDYAKPLTPQAKKAYLEEIIGDVLLKIEIPENITATSHVEKDANQIVSDPDFLKRILGNLVINAVQAMPDGGKLTLRTVLEDEEIQITVTDTGEGIPEEAKLKLFAPLFTTKSKGQGFGLAVVKRMTEALNGSVTFKSELGKGTMFIIRLPSPQQIGQ
jgi:signal transduction histidine kinase